MLTDDELLEKIKNGENITREDLGIPSWRKDCDGFEYELESLFCKSGTAYKHKDGYRWSTGEFLTKRQCKHYGLEYIERE